MREQNSHRYLPALPGQHHQRRHGRDRGSGVIHLALVIAAVLFFATVVLAVLMFGIGALGAISRKTASGPKAAYKGGSHGDPSSYQVTK